MAGYRVRTLERSDDEFYGRYRGAEISIERDHESHDHAFYIIVKESTGFTLYDGWWGDRTQTLDHAIEEALLGSQMITEQQRKFSFDRTN